jgi:hypothetical protein
MKGVLVLFGVLLVAQVASAGPRVAPRVVLGVDSKTGQRSLQLTGSGMPTYPTVDVNCDGLRRTMPLTRTDITKRRVVATYAVPGAMADAMLSSNECRLLIPGQDIGIGRRQIRSAWSPSAKSDASSAKNEASAKAATAKR